MSPREQANWEKMPVSNWPAIVVDIGDIYIYKVRQLSKFKLLSYNYINGFPCSSDVLPFKSEKWEIVLFRLSILAETADPWRPRMTLYFIRKGALRGCDFETVHLNLAGAVW
ncbi:hypothetical protein TWF225_007458 [Orbilia oligospora]|uniref:Uncharacterized protein n=1 Tax=Orbilia oligospora TaxID=2813651 RepID=A0A7C8JZV8_ORBOL|nr:hypothetical protein TWF751_001685 [Orbilia oligospora]KAF3179784.1 hypothetical protein TWF225_007458 [Orbilia oligospora]KAF3241953.1 hypothetical protein TWF128_010670 [Orbilia oligospora]KAF3252260.1 hypothetical protein TWF217_007796 [Orbilia oligospora]KAF3282489.1 hypothetical protein TWF132_010730 [Orbilia oligospora]